MVVQALRPEATLKIEITILHRLVWRDVVPFDPVILRPYEDGVRGELGARLETIMRGLPQ